MTPSNHLILCHPLLPPSIFPSIRVFSNDSVLCIRWPKYWSFSFSISPSNEYSWLGMQFLILGQGKPVMFRFQDINLMKEYNSNLNCLIYYQARLFRAFFSDLFIRLNESLTRHCYTVLCIALLKPHENYKQHRCRGEGGRQRGRLCPYTFKTQAEVFLFLKMGLLRYNSHIMQLTHLIYTIQWVFFSIFRELCKHHHNRF